MIESKVEQRMFMGIGLFAPTAPKLLPLTQRKCTKITQSNSQKDQRCGWEGSKFFGKLMFQSDFQKFPPENLHQIFVCGIAHKNNKTSHVAK